MTSDTACPHDQLTSTFEKGVHCWKCKEPLVSFFWPVSRNNTPAGALIYALMHAPQINQEPAHNHGLNTRKGANHD